MELGPIERRHGRLLLELRGVDLLDGTPVLDIKPYIPYADSIPGARGGFAAKAPGSGMEVLFTEDADRFLSRLNEGRELRRLIVGLLEQDPRPAYLESGSQRTEFGMRLFEYNIRWTLIHGGAEVVSIAPAGDK